MWDEKDERRRALAEEAAQLFQFIPKEERQCFTKEMLMDMGKNLWEASYKSTDNDYEAFAGISKFAAQIPVLDASLHLPSPQLTCGWSARWADQGFPQIVMGHKYCAALLATTVSVDLVPDVKAPWKAFLIELPNNMLFATDEDSKTQVVITRILVHTIINSAGELTWNYVANCEGALTLWRHGCSIQQLVSTDLDSCWDGCTFMVPMADQDTRVAELIGRLIVNVCLAMSNPENVKRPRGEAKGSSWASGTKRVSPHPSIRTYRLGKPIELDCRKSIEDYVHGRRGTSPSVQVLVCGHWKSQAHGPKHSLRKVIWVEPYWRGPEEAPILVRPHVMKEG